MKKSNDLVLNLSQEELLFILNLLHAPTTLGIDPEIFKDASQREIGFAVKVAERALIARGFIKPTVKGNFEIDEVPMALVGTCALPSYSILIEIASPERTINIYWHGTEHLTVEHIVVAPGIHGLRALSLQDKLIEHLSEHLPFTVEKKPDFKRMKKLDKKVYEKSRDFAVNNQIDKAEKVLINAGINSVDGHQLADLITKANTTYAIGFIRHTRPVENSLFKGGTLIISSMGCCLVEALEGSEEVDVLPFSEENWQNWLSTNLAWVRGN
jgi:hypothetical protein